MKKNEGQISAYMTLEISLLFPIIVVILVCLIYLTFYSYNQTTAYQNAAIVALYGESFSYTQESKSELITRMYINLEKLNNNQYIAVEDLKQTVSIANNKIEIIQSGNINMPIFNEKIFSKMDFSEKVVVDMKNTVFYIRQIRKVKMDES